MQVLTLPIVTWLVCGFIKFSVNALRNGSRAFDQIGHGGFPSNHTAILSSIVWLLAFSTQWNMAALGLAVLMVYVFDAVGLRREVGRHAAAINQLSGSQLREIMGHNLWDIGGGIAVGFTVALAYWSFGAL